MGVITLIAIALFATSYLNGNSFVKKNDVYEFSTNVNEGEGNEKSIKGSVESKLIDEKVFTQEDVLNIVSQTVTNCQNSLNNPNSFKVLGENVKSISIYTNYEKNYACKFEYMGENGYGAHVKTIGTIVFDKNKKIINRIFL